ncbi:hypothetical protein QQ045_030273 [Rhodiola kirilowii]
MDFNGNFPMKREQIESTKDRMKDPRFCLYHDCEGSYDEHKATFFHPFGPGSSTLMSSERFNHSVGADYPNGKVGGSNGVTVGDILQEHWPKRTAQRVSDQTSDKGLYPRTIPNSELLIARSLKKPLQTYKVPVMSTKNKSANVPVVSTSQTNECRSKYIKDIVSDAKSDKADLISAMESVLNTLKAHAAKKKEALSAKAEAASGLDAILAKATSSRRNWGKMMGTHFQLVGETLRNKSILTDEASMIRARLIPILKDDDHMEGLLDYMQKTLNSQLAQVEEEIERANLVNLQREKAQKAISDEELSVNKINEEAELIKQEAEKNSALKKILKDHRVKVNMLQEEMDYISNDISTIMKDFEKRIRIGKSTTSETSVVSNSSIVCHESEESTQSEAYEPLASMVPSLTTSASHFSVPSLENEVSEKSKTSDNKGSEEAEAYESKDSEYESSKNEEYDSNENKGSEDYESSENEGSEVYESSENEDSEDYESSENEGSEDYDSNKDSESVSEKIDKFFQIKALNLKAIAISPLPNSSEVVSSPKPVLISVERVILHNKNSTAVPTDVAANITTEAINASNDTKIPSDDDWDFCSRSSDSDSHRDA